MEDGEWRMERSPVMVSLSNHERERCRGSRIEDGGWKNTDGVAAGLQPANCGFEQQCRTREALPRTGAAEIGAANRGELEPRPDARRTRQDAPETQTREPIARFSRVRLSTQT